MGLQGQDQGCPTLRTLGAYSAGTTHSKRNADHVGALYRKGMASSKRCLQTLRDVRQLQGISSWSWSNRSLTVNVGDVAAHVVP